MNAKSHQTLLWTARILAGLVGALILIIGVGETAQDGFGSLLQLTLQEGLMMVAFLITFLGLVLGWSREKLGGWLVVVGMAAFYLLDFVFSGTFPRGVTFLIILLPGMLYLLSGYYQPALPTAE